jgi:Domain of unknown function (DUF4388)
MRLSGRLQEFTLPEIFNILEEGSKSGLLNIRVFNAQIAEFTKYCIWLKGGKIVGLSENPDGQDLINWLSQQSIVSAEQRRQLPTIAMALKDVDSLGAYLRTQHWVTPAQVDHIFSTTVVNPIMALFKIKEGFFTFNAENEPPKIALIGLGIAGSNLNLLGLRQLADWEHLQTKLPEVTASIRQSASTKAISSLLPVEQQMLTLADGKIAIKQMAAQLNQPIAAIQQVAFRLIVVGLAVELPMVSTVKQPEASTWPNLPRDAMVDDRPPVTAPADEAGADRTTATSSAPLSGKFLNNFTTFLQKRLNQPAKSAAPGSASVQSPQLDHR